MVEESTPLIEVKFSRRSSQSSSEHDGTPWYVSVFMVVNAALGAGMLEFPYSFSQSGGVTAALIVQAILISFIVGSLFLLAYCSQMRNTSTFPSTINTICGRPVEVVSSLCIILYTYGTCITFLIVINDQLSQLFYFITKDAAFCHHWYMDQRFTLSLTSVLFILPLLFSKRIDFLKYVSFAGVVAILYVVFLIIARYVHPINDISKVHVSTSPSSAIDVFSIIPTICFSYQCHVSAIPIYSCMRDRNLKNFAKTVFIAMSICIFAYSVSATLGYYTFGDAVQQDILKSYTPPPVDVMIGVSMIAAKTYTTYPILTFCGRVEVEKLYRYAFALNEDDAQRHELKRRCVIAIVWFATTLIIAIYVPNIAIVINVLGGLAALFIFFFPGMCLLKIAMDYISDEQKRKKTFLKVCSVCFMLIGSFLFGLTTAQAIQKDIANNPSPGTNGTCL